MTNPGSSINLTYRYNVFREESGGHRRGMMFLLLIIVALTIFSPLLVISDNLPTLKLEDPILLGALGYLIFLKRPSFAKIFFQPAIRPVTVPVFWLTTWLLVISVLIFMNESYGSVNSFIFPILSRLKGPILTVFIVAVIRNKKMVRIFGALLIFFLCIELAILFAQHHDLLNVHNWLTPFYRRDMDIRFAFAGRRSSGTYGNPNIASVAVAIFLTFVVSSAFWNRISYRSKALLMGISIISVAFVIEITGSRTGLVCCLVAFGVPLLIRMLVKGRMKGLVTIGLVMILVQPIANIFFARSLRADRFLVFTSELSLLEEMNFAARIDNWGDILESMGDSIIFGKGIMALADRVTDNSYVTVILISGLIGLILYLWLFIAVARRFIRAVIKSDADSVVLHYATIGLSCLVVSLVAGMTMSIDSNARLFSTFMIVIGLCLAAIRIYITKRNTHSKVAVQGLR